MADLFGVAPGSPQLRAVLPISGPKHGGLALMAVLAGPGEYSADDAQSVAQNVPFAQTPHGAPLLFPGDDSRSAEAEPAVSRFTADEALAPAYGAETTFDCGAGSHCDGDGDCFPSD